MRTMSSKDLPVRLDLHGHRHRCRAFWKSCSLRHSFGNIVLPPSLPSPVQQPLSERRSFRRGRQITSFCRSPCGDRLATSMSLENNCSRYHGAKRKLTLTVVHVSKTPPVRIGRSTKRSASPVPAIRVRPIKWFHLFKWRASDQQAVRTRCQGKQVPRENVAFRPRSRKK